MAAKMLELLELVEREKHGTQLNNIDALLGCPIVLSAPEAAVTENHVASVQSTLQLYPHFCIPTWQFYCVH